MTFKPVSRVRLSTQIEGQISQQILEGVWKVGEKLPSENELAEIFQVSRVSIRQALQSLSSRGLIETRVGNGSYVRQPGLGDLMDSSIPLLYLSEDSFRDVMEFRMLFEGPVAEMAAVRTTEEQLQKMETLYQQMLESANNPQENSRIDFEFHQLIGEMSGNSMVQAVYRVQNGVLRSSLLNLATRVGTAGGIRYHGLLLEAFRRKDPKECRRVMEEHVLDSWNMSFG